MRLDLLRYFSLRHLRPENLSSLQGEVQTRKESQAVEMLIESEPENKSSGVPEFFTPQGLGMIPRVSQG